MARRVKHNFYGDGLVKKALIKDVQRIYELTEFFAKKGDMLHRPVTEVYSGLRDFFVYEEDARIVGVAALQICWEGLSEIRSLAVEQDMSGRGIGTELVRACLEEARGLGLDRVFTLTYAPAFFKKMGFHAIEKDVLPHKIWSDCVKCFKFPNCDENALMLEL